MKRLDSFVGMITGVDERGGLIEFGVQDLRFPVDFGPKGRLRGWGPWFFITEAKGFARDKSPEEYTEFGAKGLCKGIRVRCFVSRDGETIMSVVPLKKRVRKPKV